MNENTEKYVKWARKNVDRLTVGVMYCLLLVLLYLWYSEQSAAIALPEGGQPLKLPELIEEHPVYKSVVLASKKKPEISEFPEIDQVRKFNMFDYKTVQTKEAIEREANSKFRQAKELADKGQNDEAKALLEGILSTFPNHQQARDLYNKINPRKSPEATPKSPAPAAAGQVPKDQSIPL